MVSVTAVNNAPILLSGTGKTTTDLGSDDYAQSCVIQRDHKILAFGRSSGKYGYDFSLCRYNSEGDLDSSFSNSAIWGLLK